MWKAFLGGLALSAALAVPAIAADEFPGDKTIEVVIHAKYGGGTDTTARMMMIRSRKELGTDMIVVSKRGGSGAAAQEYVMSRPADGYTLLALTQSHLYTIARGKGGMKIEDMVGVVRAMDDPTFITVQKDSKFKTLADLIAASKESPLNWGVGDIGSTEHIGLLQFAKAAGIKVKVVPFGSGAQMVQALMSGAIDATLPNVSEALSQVQDGTFRPLVVMAEARLSDFPDVPTTIELGFNVKTSTTRGYAVKAGTPEPIIQKLSDAMVKAMGNKVFGDYLRSSGLDPKTSVADWKVWDKQLKEEYANARDAMIELGLIK
jgi:putative tricarboxylic transport membrane protein